MFEIDGDEHVVTTVEFYLARYATPADMVRRARELDENGLNAEDIPEEYTLPQAMQILFNNDPTWFFANVVSGWVLTHADGQPIWGDPNATRVPNLTNRSEVEQWLDKED